VLTKYDFKKAWVFRIVSLEYKLIIKADKLRVNLYTMKFKKNFHGNMILSQLTFLNRYGNGDQHV
jgi:hypothetical protein